MLLLSAVTQLYLCDTEKEVLAIYIYRNSLVVLWPTPAWGGLRSA